jgi:hypothetical protein
MAWSDEHRAFVVDELIQNGGSPGTFSPSDIVSEQNFRYWAHSNPRGLQQYS